ncbi:hypothetical protein BD626DRAFT_429134 [Schizophyllum amplum]|uniref:DUF6533 domain-containing protein n=1 Tax=Schizophyllum amplum TaxID=97359 RepID=A0A550CJ05_9AGAR|nr:hypothetical protein BD626DRAFT_429134 [Auriculariopsis ampla]
MAGLDDDYAALYKGNLVPLHACLVGLVWVVYDYLLTLGDEVRLMWPLRSGFAKWSFFWIRYYTLALLVFDVIQIHTFAIPGVTSDSVCVAMDAITRIVGAILLWSVEIIMQLRVYALYRCSKWVAMFNGVLFLASIGGFLYTLITNAMLRHDLIAGAEHLNLPGCPVIHSIHEWPLWLPATIFEVILFLFALAASMRTLVSDRHEYSLRRTLIRDNLTWFFGVGVLLVLNQLMVSGVTGVPWFSYSPFHAAVGVLTSRMLLNMRGSNSDDITCLCRALGDPAPSQQTDLPTMRFSGGGRSKLQALTGDVRFAFDRDITLVESEMEELRKPSLRRISSCHRDSMYTHGRRGGGSTGSLSLDLEFAPNPDAPPPPPPPPPQPAPSPSDSDDDGTMDEDAHVYLADRAQA